ncbi:MAG: molybdopterin-dependent oxidoreductase, partial [Gammaproteobacteria bacterium]|nr:molybdopterin-dependent oxidoreductase [Gammaproteobacteria bacterium]
MTEISRRTFIKIGVAAGGAMWVGISTSVHAVPSAPPAQGSEINPWIRIDANGEITVSIDKSEMGQGVVVGLAMLVAEELDAEWSQIRTEFAPAAPIYKNLKFRIQSTGGSTSMVSSWDNLRRMGATARALLIAAAARRWGVAVGDCVTQPGRVVHTASGRHLSYGELVADAAHLPVPEVKLKDPTRYRLIGKSLPRPDVIKKTQGTAIYG